MVALLAVLGTAAALGFTSRNPRHARVNGATAGISRVPMTTTERLARAPEALQDLAHGNRRRGRVERRERRGHGREGPGDTTGSPARSSTSTPSASGTTDTDLGVAVRGPSRADADVTADAPAHHGHDPAVVDPAAPAVGAALGFDHGPGLPAGRHLDVHGGRDRVGPR